MELELELELAEYIALYHASLTALDSLAVHYARHQALLQQHMLHILLFVPETVNHDGYVQLIKHSQSLEAQTIPVDGSLDEAAIDTSPAVVKLAMQEVVLSSLTLEDFLERRVKATDSVIGQIEPVMPLLNAFPEILVSWREHKLMPLAAIQRHQNLSLSELEAKSAPELINLIVTSDEPVQDTLAAIWMPLRHGHEAAFDQALQVFILDHAASAETLLAILTWITQYKLSAETKDNLSTAILGACYLNQPLSKDRKANVANLAKVLSLLKSTLKDGTCTDEDSHSSIDSLLAYESLLQPNLLTTPVKDSAVRLETFVEAARQFSSARYNPSIRDILAISLADAQTQRHQLTRILAIKRSDDTFQALRKLLFSGKILTQLDQNEIDFALLKSCLQKDSLEIAKKTYITTSPRPLPAATVEQALLQAFYETFDNASDLSRKSLQPASDILSILHPKHTNQEVRRGQLLADAAIELSSFGDSLCMPIELRQMTPDSLRDLAAQALQSHGVYKRWQRLIGILKNLKLALQLPDTESLQEIALLEIVANAALAEDDLAYALVLAREAAENEEEAEVDSGAWRLAYQVSKYPTDRPASVAAQRVMLEQALVRCPQERLFALLTQFDRLQKTERDLAGDGGTLSVPSFSRESSARSVHGGMIEMPKSLLQAAQAARALTFGNESTQGTAEGRVRKRDQLAGLVGSGVGAVESRLSSGVSWLIGAE